ncbi:prostaglandin E synthase 2 [Diabrotica virgifera virgifera]|uniref:Prostaglandin E synthase 2 n=1 Tax=Diabrotica virgifera virgifera TaxID=50390 RepID=A0ABM5KE39_DIAVI|nr:prostaglandin E synthase 2 [Diabrotica virgifera virgifera]
MLNFTNKIVTRTLLFSYRPNLVKNGFKNFTTSTSRNIKRGTFRLGLTGITVGALVGTGYSIHYMNKPRAHILNEEITIAQVKEMPSMKPTRFVKNVGDMGLELTLYQYQTCPFCCKVRAFLDYYGISYNLIEVDPVLRQAIKWSPYRKVPILVVKTDDGYQPLIDSTMIVSALASYLFEDNKKDLPEIVKCFPNVSYVDDDGLKKNEIMNRYFIMLNNRKDLQAIEQKSSEERKWRKWADSVLVHTLSPNVYRTSEEALQSFNWFSEVGEWEANFPSWERYLMIYVGASAMWLIGKRLKKRHNLKDDVRQSLYDECNYWLRAVKSKGGQFMGGQTPNLADLAVYGVLSSIEGCLAFKDLLNNTKIGPWYFGMKQCISEHEGAKSI